MLLALPLISQAHGYWLHISGDNQANSEVTVRMFFGDYPAGATLSGNALNKMRDIKVYVHSPTNNKLAIKMNQLEGYWEGSFTPTEDGTYIITGINDTREVQDWTQHHLGIVRPVQYLKAYYTIGKKASEKSTPFLLDIAIDKRSDKKIILTVLKEGSPLADQIVDLSAYGTDVQSVTTDKNGKAKIELSTNARYIISADWIDTTPGTFEGKAYETVRHRLDVTYNNK